MTKYILSVFKISILFFAIEKMCFGSKDPLTDSIYSKYESQIGKDKLNKGIALLNEYYYRGNLHDGIVFGLKLLTEAVDQNNIDLEPIILNRIGTIYHLKKQDEKALPLYLRALESFKENDNKEGISKVLKNMGNVYRNLGYDSKSLEYYVKSLKICEEIKDHEGIGYAYKNIAILYEGQQWWGKALEYHLKVLEIRKKAKNERTYSTALLNTAYVLVKLKKPEEALVNLNKAIEIGKKNHSIFEEEAFLEIGNVYFLLGKFELAKQYYLQAKSNAKNKHRYSISLEALGNLTLISIQKSELKEAKMFLTEIENLFDSSSATKDKLNYFHLSYLLDSANGNERLAFKWLKKEVQLKNETIENRMSEELIQKRVALDLIELENSINLERANKKNLELILIGFIFLSMILIIAFALFIYVKTQTNKKLKRKKEIIETQNEELNAINEELFSTNDKLEKANAIIEIQKEKIENKNKDLESEVSARTLRLVEYTNQLEQYSFMTAHNLRGCVARILGLGNILNLGTIDKKQKDELVRKIYEETLILDMTLKELNQIIDIKNNHNQGLQLVQFEKLVEKIKLTLGQEITEIKPQLNCDFSNLESLLTVPQYMESIFYNFVSNSIKYRELTRPLEINITSDVIEDQFVLKFKDNGLGIDLKENSHRIFTLYSRFNSNVYGRGMGLFLVKSQVEALGGTIDVESELGNGTTFIISLKRGSN